MARRSDHSRQELRQMALEAAQEIIRQDGIGKLTTRRVAKRIGYTVGTLYLVFKDMDDLILAINADTVRELHSRIEHGVIAKSDPVEQLREFSRNYLAYARENPNLWRLAFEFQSAPDTPFPEVISREIDTIRQYLTDILQQLSSQQSASDLRVQVAAFWAGIHGICHLTVTDSLKVAGVESVQAVLDRQLEAFMAGCPRIHLDQPPESSLC